MRSVRIARIYRCPRGIHRGGRQPERHRRARRRSGTRAYAHKLRRTIGLLVADEGERLSNPTSDQSRALWQLSARRRFVLTGSPIANYPRDVFGLIAFTGGDGTAAQPYGYRRG